jgi:hypothetical protein
VPGPLDGEVSAGSGAADAVQCMTPEGAVDRFDEDATAGGNWDFINTLNVTCRVKATTAAMACPARHLAALQLLGIERLFLVVVRCQAPRGTHPDDRPTAPSRMTVRPACQAQDTACKRPGRHAGRGADCGTRMLWSLALEPHSQLSPACSAPAGASSGTARSTCSHCSHPCRSRLVRHGRLCAATAGEPAAP